MEHIRVINKSNFTAYVLQEKLEDYEGTKIILCRVVWYGRKEEFVTWVCTKTNDLFHGNYYMDYNSALEGFEGRN